MRSTAAPISSTKNEPVKAVTAGIRNTAPVTMPSAAAIDNIQSRTLQAVCGTKPVEASAQVAPLSAAHENRRCRPMPNSTIITSARPSALNSTRRNSGEAICANAL